MRLFRLTVKAPGTLLSRLLEADITPDQFAQIDKLIREPNDWFLISREQLTGGAAPRRIGFQPREAPPA